VKTEITYGKDVFTIDYKLVNMSQTYTIYDIVFDEVSLEETYREAYVPIIAKEGWANLLKRMKDKLTELERG
jgi:ABC-type transporter MlaC component